MIKELSQKKIKNNEEKIIRDTKKIKRIIRNCFVLYYTNIFLYLDDFMKKLNF